MASVYQNIRGALQVRAATAQGFPLAANCAYEGTGFNPVVGIAWAKLTLLPQLIRPAVIGGVQKLHSGIFQVDIFTPAGGGPGTGAAEVLADAVRDVFAEGASFSQGGETVLIDYAERAQAIIQPDWIQIPVTVHWRCYSPNN